MLAGNSTWLNQMPFYCAPVLEVRRQWGGQWKFLLLTSAVMLDLPQLAEHWEICVFMCLYSLSGESKRHTGGSRVGEVGKSDIL